MVFNELYSIEYFIRQLTGIKLNRVQHGIAKEEDATYGDNAKWHLACSGEPKQRAHSPPKVRRGGLAAVSMAAGRGRVLTDELKLNFQI